MTPPVQPTPGQGQPAPQPGAPRVLTGADMNLRIAHGDPAYPRELWGRTLAEGMRYYNVMREDFMRRNQPGQPPLQGEPAGGAPPRQAPPPAPAPRGYEPPAPAAQPAPGGFDEAALNARIEAAVAAALAHSPVTRISAENVRDQMRRENADWMQYEQQVLEALGGADANALMNPEVWRAAYYYAKGKAMSSGAPAPAPAPQPGQPIHTPAPAAPTSYFTEAPAAPPANGGAAPSSLMNDPQVIAMARRFNIPLQEYVLWMGGNVPPMAGGPNGRS